MSRVDIQSCKDIKTLTRQECSGSKEYFWMLLQSGIMHDLMVEKEENISGTQYLIIIVYHNKSVNP
jgi:hypothetical protein